MTTLRAREIDVIVRVQGTTFARAAVPVGKALSLFGEHAAGWIVLGLIGAVLDLQRVVPWLVSVTRTGTVGDVTEAPLAGDATASSGLLMLRICTVLMSLLPSRPVLV